MLQVHNRQASHEAASWVQIGALDPSSEESGLARVHTGLEFDELPPLEKTDAVAVMSVFARVEPSHKSRLVELLQAQVARTHLLLFLTHACRSAQWHPAMRSSNVSWMVQHLPA